MGKGYKIQIGPYKIQTAPGYYYKTDELLRCFNKITTLWTSSLDVPPCTMGRTPTRFKQHRVTTTRPMNCYAVSTSLRRSRHFFFPFFSPIRTWTAVREPAVCESGVREPGVREPGVRECLLKGRRVCWNC
ncbi:hypothetical protein TNCV_1346611 [Trichonephila clavipes]|nr:hypothetical protein TNCV_1346611 [Trichonephila clavipes]